jgi:Spy/CpxP family protein refolding chaperone
MKRQLNRNMMAIVLSLVLMVSMGSWALANEAMHGGAQGMKHECHHGQMMKRGGRCPMGAMGRMGVSSEDMQKIRGMCAKFFKDTLTLRQDIQSKKLALESELVKAAPNAKSAMTLQTELSNLKAQMAQKRLAHLLQIKKIAPAANIRWLARCAGFRGMGEKDRAHHRHGMKDDDD